MAEFTYPNHHSVCETILTSGSFWDAASFMARVKVSAGYNLYGPDYHLIGVHLGNELPILRRYQQQEKLFTLQRGSTFLTPMGAELQSAHPVLTDALYIHLSPASLKTVADGMGIDSRQIELSTVLDANDPVIARIGQEALEELNHPGLGGAIYLEALLTQLCVRLIRQYVREPREVAPQGWYPSSPPSYELRHAIEFIHAHLSENLTLTEIAAVEGLSPFHFSRCFRARYGIPPHQYLIRARVERAAALLKNPRLTVSDVALAVGFANHSHLIRHFKRWMGVTPNVYRVRGKE